MNHEILLDHPNQVFVHESLAGHASEPFTVTVEGLDGMVEQATRGTCAIEEVETRLTADAPLGAAWLTVAESDGIIACRAYVVGTQPAQERVFATGVRGSRVLVHRPVVRALAAGAAVRGCRLSIGVDPDWQRAQSRRVDLAAWG